MLSIWKDVDCYYEYMIDNDTLKEVENRLDKTKYEIIRTNKRMLPQLNYYYEPMYITDIVFRYEEKYYILFANIVCFDGIHAKYFRKIEQVYPGLIEIKQENVNFNIVDTKVKFILSERNNLKDCKCGYIQNKYNYNNTNVREFRYFGTYDHVENVGENVPEYDNFEELGYYDDPSPKQILISDGNTSKYVDVISLLDKYKTWHKVAYIVEDKYIYRDYMRYINQFIIPDDMFDCLCFSMIAHKYHYIGA